MLRTGEDFTDPPHASNPSAGGFGYMETFTYPVPHPAPRARGQPAGQRWDGEKMITYKGWNWRCVVASGFGSLGVCLALRRGASGSGGNQHGYMYQAQCIHRCMAAGLTEFPQHTRAESIQVCEIIDEINQQCSEIGF